MSEISSATPTLGRVAFLGAGSMGGAILRGLLNSDFLIGQIVATVRTAAGAERFDDLGERITVLNQEKTAAANREAARDADVIVLGVKPAQVSEVLGEIAPVLAEDAIIISLAAGVTTVSCEQALGTLRPKESFAIVRAMPNTPALIGLGMTGLAAGSAVKPEQLDLVQRLFATVGKTMVVAEEQINAVTAISGSGPAYIFLLMEEFTKAAERLGFQPSDAALLVEQTFHGAVNLQAKTGNDPAQLRAQVTSPKGTTERAVQQLQSSALADVFEQAARAALARAEELAAGSA